MKNLFFCLVVIFNIKQGAAQPEDSTYYFNNGIPYYVTQQSDVLSFRLTDKSYCGDIFDPLIVDDVKYYGNSDGIHNVFFSATATDIEKETVMYSIQLHPNFEKFFAVATKTSNYDRPYSDKLWMATDMQMTIIFKDPQITLSEVEAFAAEYQTKVIFAPEIDGGVYVLEVHPNHQLFDYHSPTLTIEIVRQMWLDHEDMISKIAPSIRIFEPYTEDPYYNDQWWMDDALTTSCNGSESPAGIGIDLPCAWNYDYAYSDGPMYSVEGVVVSVIDFHGVQWDHPDLDGSFTDGWIAYGDVDGEASVIKIFSSGGNVYHAAWNEAHLQNVSGVISADMDNAEGSVGVAHNSTIVPCLMQGTNAQFSALLMRLLSDGLQTDVINMSFGFGGMTVAEAEGFPFYEALRMCRDDGREGKGIVLIAAAGNSNGNSISIPAALPIVFSVAGTNPDDQLKTAGDGYDPVEGTWGSSYFPYLDVAAPSICISSTDFSDEDTGFPDEIGDGYVDGDYYGFSGTSAAAPIVSGIAALILEKDPTLSNQQVYDAIRLSSEKVGGYDYSSYAPDGRCLELGYGRVNACAALNILGELGVEESSDMKVNYNNPVNGELLVNLDQYSEYSVEIMSLTGQMLLEKHFSDVNQIQINLSDFESGIYLIRLIDVKTKKLCVFRIANQ